MMIEKNETNLEAHGGSELMSERLNRIGMWTETESLQVIVSRFRGFDTSKEYHIFYSHDLPSDPESVTFFGNNQLLRQIDAIVFVSYHQMNSFLNAYPLLWNRRRKCFVVRNAIEDVANHRLIQRRKNRLIYTSTPQRGLNILFDAFKRIKKDVPDLELEVYSTFKLYGWDQRDNQFRDLFNELDSTPGVHRSKEAVSNAEIQEALSQASIFAYPSIWEETSCLCLIEALANGLKCVTSDLGALPETGGGFNWMYSGTGIRGNSELTSDRFTPTMIEESKRFELLLRESLDDQCHIDDMFQVHYASTTFGLHEFYHSWLNVLNWVKLNGHKN